MRAYENPVFVEDIVRNAAERLEKDARVAWFRVHAKDTLTLKFTESIDDSIEINKMKSNGNYYLCQRDV